MMFIKTHNFTAAALSHFRDLQRTSFTILEETAAGLVGGETEKEVAHALVKRYRAAGAGSFFHLPVVLFGERTALPGDWAIGNFFPKARTLETGDSVILDAAPLFGGYLVDTSYSFCFGESNEHREMMQHLAQYRDSVPAAVNKWLGEAKPIVEFTQDFRSRSPRWSLAGRAACGPWSGGGEVGRNFGDRRRQSAVA